MGFRREALTSISSISCLQLTSCPAEQEEAGQAYTEARDMRVILKPASHPLGSTIEVLNLFHNTPARRKFLRTDKIEWQYIDEVARRLNLSRFDVSIDLLHNGKLLRQYVGIQSASQNKRHLLRLLERPIFKTGARTFFRSLKDNSILYRGCGWDEDDASVNKLSSEKCLLDSSASRPPFLKGALISECPIRIARGRCRKKSIVL